MKRTVIAIALAFALAVPFTGTSMADPKYSVRNDNTILWQHSFARGNVRCKVNREDVVLRHWGKNWSRWIYVRIHQRTHGFNVGLLDTCRGWVDKRGLISLPN